MSHTEEMVYVTTEDGLLLEGLALHPADSATHPGRKPAIVWIHGNAASFSAQPYVALGRELVARGFPVIIGNSRGHDIAATLWRSGGAPAPIGGGAGWERLEDAPIDLAAWVEFAAALGQGSVVLAGHSSGAQRVVLYQAERQDRRVAGLVLASPDLRGFLPPGELEAAQRLVDEGRGLEVTPAHPFAPWYRQSAQTVVNKAGILSHMLEAEDGRPTIAALHAPILAFYGGREQGGEARLENIRRQASGAARVDTEIVADTDHFYAGSATAVAAVIAHWVSSRTGNARQPD